jgi:N-glycosylase/DNA lyase
LASLKLARIEKLLGSGVPALLRSQGLEQLGLQPMILWHELATGMRQKPDDKTIAFAMKVFDLQHRIATGRYAQFPTSVPIVADLRIARVSLSSGLLRPTDGSVQDAMANVTKEGGFDANVVREVWASVAEHTQGISLFRVDSLAWQVAEPVHRLRQQDEAAKEAVVQTLRRYHAPDAIAHVMGAEMTAALR